MNEFGTVTEVKIINHGLNYSLNPSIVASNPNCMCNRKVGPILLQLNPCKMISDRNDRQPGDVIGNLDPCFILDRPFGGR